jgi:hypothetical protein
MYMVVHICLATGHQDIHIQIRFRFIVFNATFSTIAVTSWRSVLLVEKTGVLQKTTDLSHVTDKLYHINTEYMCHK